MNDMMIHQKVKGALSEAVTSSDFFKWWMSLPADKTSKGWLGSSNRTDARDRVFEAYLKSKAVGPNGTAFLLAAQSDLLKDVTEQTNLREFFELVRENYPKPLPVLIDIVKASGVPVKHITDAITGEHVDGTEEAIKILVRLKQGGKRQPKIFEGIYHDTSPGHNKFWELTYIGGEKPYRATWGRIEKYPNVQGHKDYTEPEAADLAREKTLRGNYEKQ